MRYSFAPLLCVIFLGLAGSSLQVQAEDPSASSSSAPAFYGWLEKYQNPTVEHPVQNAQPRVSQPTSDVVRLPSATSLPSSWTPLLEIANTDQGEQVVGPGEGLGCYYHRSYYSHLPLFNKNGNYSLRGDIDVAEPYHQSSEHVSAASRHEAR